MKKVYSLFSTLLISGATVFAQFANVENNGPALDDISPTEFQRILNKVGTPKTTSATSRWYNYWEVKNALGGGNASLHGNYLFPDSNITAEFGGTTQWATPWVHNIGTILDPTANYFNDILTTPAGELLIRDSDSYTLDSLSIIFGYYRSTSASVVDTLVVELATNSLITGYNYYHGTTNSIIQNLATVNPGVDTCRFILVPYMSATNTMSLTPVTTFKLPMDSAFHANDSIIKDRFQWSFATTGVPPTGPGRFIYTNVYFKPGFSYSLSDTISTATPALNTKNFARFFSLQENGNGSGSGTFPRYDKNDWNQSSIVNTAVKYNLPSAGGFANRFVPSFAFMGGATGAGYSFENHWIDYKLSCATCDAVSTNDIDKNVAKLGNAYPNPASAGEGVTIPISISNVNSEVEIKVYNTIGQEVKSVKGTELKAGINEITINTANMNAGVYLYSLELDGETFATSRFSVVK